MAAVGNSCHLEILVKKTELNDAITILMSTAAAPPCIRAGEQLSKMIIHSFMIYVDRKEPLTFVCHAHRNGWRRVLCFTILTTRATIVSR